MQRLKSWLCDITLMLAVARIVLRLLPRLGRTFAALRGGKSTQVCLMSATLCVEIVTEAGRVRYAKASLLEALSDVSDVEEAGLCSERVAANQP